MPPPNDKIVMILGSELNGEKPQKRCVCVCVARRFTSHLQFITKRLISSFRRNSGLTCDVDRRQVEQKSKLFRAIVVGSTKKKWFFFHFSSLFFFCVSINNNTKLTFFIILICFPHTAPNGSFGVDACLRLHNLWFSIVTVTLNRTDGNDDNCSNERQAYFCKTKAILMYD